MPGSVRRVVLLASTAVALAIAPPGSADADVVTEWNAHAAAALGAAGQPPSVSPLGLAMVHGAVHDAVAAIDRGYEPYLRTPRARRWYSQDAAAATAAHGVLVSLVPDRRAAIDTLLLESLVRVPAGPARDGGIAVGRVAAAAMVAERMGDGRSGPFRFPVGTAPGQWRPPPGSANDPNAWVAQVRPFVVHDPGRFGSRGPNALTSARYAAEFDEVKAIGSRTSTVRTADQTDAARFWSGGYAPWILALRELPAARGLDLAASARLFALTYLGLADAGITCWQDKARWRFWRPITAIREAATDGNPATEPDPAWESLIPSPPYPDHPSGLMCFAGAIAGTVRHVLGTDAIAFSVTSAASGTRRSFATVSQALQEALDARVWSGIHFRTADEQGARIGLRVARAVSRHELVPRRGRGGSSG
jgi:hypothetical protein